ncbi:MAG: AAA family ATPase [Mesorhizobium sp.]|uniref:AAA family ATPase n=1 Tax=Mesorhizobium sp. TaxID=1871066 RepID=UPI00120B1A8D|nr:AAA family ATPase [Mesorhizobium sp.]TIP03854.1 MAG: AAA family ATPase [Mesorhizobium sp.]
MPQAQPEDTRRQRAEAYQKDWGGALFEQADGDWLVVGSVIGTGAVQSVRFNASGLNKVEIPLGGKSKSKPHAANDNKLFASIIPPTSKTPAADELRRLKRLAARYGGQLTGSAIIRNKNGTEKDTPAGNIWIHSDGKPYFRTGDGGAPCEEPAPLVATNPAEWQGMPVPAREWYVEDLIPMRQVTLLYGDGGVGKSLLALQIAAAGAMSIETLGLAPCAGKVLYLGAEDEESEFQRRLADVCKSHGRDLSDLSMFRLLPMADKDALLSVPDKSGTMQPTPLWLDVSEFAESYEPKLIVLDTVADLFAGDEIKRGQARQFITMLRKLAIRINCAVILLAHPSVQGMTSGTGTSGSTGWSNSSRSRLYLTRGDKDDDSDLRVLKTMKINYGKVGGELKLRWHEGAFVLDDGKPSPAAGLIARRDDELFRELISAINRSGQRVAPTKGVNYAPNVLALRPEAKGVSKKALEAAMHRLLAAGLIKVIMDGPPSKQRQRLIVSAEDFGPDEEAA